MESSWGEKLARAESPTAALCKESHFPQTKSELCQMWFIGYLSLQETPVPVWGCNLSQKKKNTQEKKSTCFLSASYTL